jgi:hypothetical protein
MTATPVPFLPIGIMPAFTHTYARTACTINGRRRHEKETMDKERKREYRIQDTGAGRKNSEVV